MPSVNASGTQAAVVGTEHVLASPAAAGVFALLVDTSNMGAGDTVELRIYLKTVAASTLKVAYKVSYSGVQSTDDQVKVSVPVPVTHQLQATLKQTAGTGRSFDWELQAL